jgi:hypothetical protein
MEPAVNLLLFVHSVEALDQGLYFFFRTDEDLDLIKRGSHPDFLWNRVHEGFSLYLLKKGNFRHAAMEISCHQEIAGSSAFSVGMITKFHEIIKREPYRYRHLFWETGMIGQVLYLEAEAHSVRGTGIGCFFDDAVHDILGFKDNTWQSLYHFTVGDPLEDPRLTTHSAYHGMVPQESTGVAVASNSRFLLYLGFRGYVTTNPGQYRFTLLPEIFESLSKRKKVGKG